MDRMGLKDAAAALAAAFITTFSQGAAGSLVPSMLSAECNPSTVESLFPVICPGGVYVQICPKSLPISLSNSHFTYMVLYTHTHTKLYLLP